MEQKLILIIGGGKEAVPGIIHLQNNGYKILVTDKSINSPSKKIANYFIKSSIYNISQTIKKIIKFNEKYKIHAVLSLSADVPLTVAKCAKVLGLNSMPINTAKIFSNKLLMKKFFKKNNINTPYFKSISSLKKLKSIIKKNKEYVIKPIDSRGARGVLKFNLNNDISKFYKETKKNTKLNKIILEEYIEGQQLSTETVIYNGKVVTVGVSDRNYDKLKEFSPYIIENGSDLPSIYHRNYITKINNLIKKISKKSGITNGSLKGDLVIYKKKIYVVEIAARLSGGYFSSKMIPEYNGFNLIKKVAEIYLGNKVDISKKNVQKKFISQRFFFPKVGKIKSIKIPKWIKKSKNLVYFELNASKGDTIKNIKNHTDRVGQIIVKSKNRKNSKNIINKMIKSVVFKY